MPTTSAARHVASRRSGPKGKTLSFEDAKSGVATLSQHMIFRAIDFTVGGGKRLEAFNVAKSLRGQKFDLPVPIRMANPQVRKVGYVGGRTVPFHEGGLKLTETSFEFHGGLGLYSTFIHIDCRGQDQTW